MAWNTALGAHGANVTYLDDEDEYHPDYLAHVAQFRDKGDVLVFGYDTYRSGAVPGVEGETWPTSPKPCGRGGGVCLAIRRSPYCSEIGMV